jgi:transcriptional regulator of heat shock response
MNNKKSELESIFTDLKISEDQIKEFYNFIFDNMHEKTLSRAIKKLEVILKKEFKKYNKVIILFCILFTLDIATNNKKNLRTFYKRFGEK